MTVPRGVGDLIAACGAIAAPLEVVGSPSADFDPGGLDHVTFTGRLPHPQALKRMQQASVGVSPLRAEPNYVHSLPTKVLEYLAMGLAVVATDLPGTRSVVDGLDGVVLADPGSVESLREAITEALTSELAAAASGQAMAIRQQFSWPEEEVVRFYESLGGTRHPS